MTITLDPELSARLNERAQRRGITAEAVALDVLRLQLLSAAPVLEEPRDEWERHLRGLATDCGVALSDEAVSREGIDED